MSNALAGLSPESLWSHFSALAEIPRPSKHEERVVEWVRAVARRHDFEVRADAAGNLVVVVPATPGHESSPVVVLQSHLDMVCEKNNDVVHDFMNDPIRTRLDGEWVTATGTTLGADNGIGVAAALAAATDPSVVHGPLELLFTLDEETGLTGAKELDPAIVKGRMLFNLDSEEDGVLFVGCAGGADTHLRLTPEWTPAPAGSRALRLSVGGLRGGHSGINIHENRGNALKVLAHTLLAALEQGLPFRIGAPAGGSKHNAIPREAQVTLWAAAEHTETLKSCADGVAADFSTALAGIDDGLTVSLEPHAAGAETALAPTDAVRLIRLLAALPHGVLAMSPDIEGLVETSNNVAAISRDGDQLLVVTSGRSSVGPTMRQLTASVAAAGRLAGAEVEIHDGYPGWKPDLSSSALQVLREVYAEQWGQQPEVTAVHAGLECGLLGEKFPAMDMISFGPLIEGAHSPEERVHVPSVARFWEALKTSLGRVA